MLHPEVKNISLVTLLFAGKASLTVLNTPFYINTVKKLKQWSQSAGNQSNLSVVELRTSETLRNEMVNTVFFELIKPISVHVPRHLKPISDEQFGHYLAGLIDGDGHFSSKQQLVIVFDIKSISLAYYIKERIGYGSVKKVKDKNAFLFILTSFYGLEKVLSLIHSKIRGENIINQIDNNIVSHKRFVELKDKYPLELNKSNDLENHWLAGFSDADASFQIKVVSRNNKTEIRLNYQIDQKNKDLLILIKNFIGGNIGYRASQDTYYYGSTSFGSAKNVIKYFNQYHMLSNKHVNYLKWRKAYILIQNKDHLNEEGVKKITKLKNTMNDFSSKPVFTI